MDTFFRAYRVAGVVYTDHTWHSDALHKAINTLTIETGRSYDAIAKDIDNGVIEAEHGFEINGKFLTDYEYAPGFPGTYIQPYIDPSDDFDWGADVGREIVA
jgi:hypothetical protein